MKIFTFTNTKHNYASGEYDFIAKNWLDALQRAVGFENKFNKTVNENYNIIFNLNRNFVKEFKIESGFVNIRGRSVWKSFLERKKYEDN